MKDHSAFLYRVKPEDLNSQVDTASILMVEVKGPYDVNCKSCNALIPSYQASWQHTPETVVSVSIVT